MAWFWGKKRAAREAALAAAANAALTERPPDPREELLTRLLALEQTRLEASIRFEEKKAELQLEREKMELAELERTGAEKRKQLLFDQELKAKRQEHARKIRAQKAELAKQKIERDVRSHGCEECDAIKEGRPPTHSSDLIRHNLERHVNLFLQAPNGAQ